MTNRMRAFALALAAVLLLPNHPVFGDDDSRRQGAADDFQRARPRLLLIQEDKVVAFDPFTGIGAQTGTVKGAIRGTSIVNFQFQITTFPEFTFNNRVGITDLDGDQIIFRNVGTGRFLYPPLQDPTLAPGEAPFQVFGDGGPGTGIGGPLVGTYEVVATTGKFIRQFPIGKVFRYRAVAYNPSVPPTAPGTTGSVYVEVYSR
jgi:hypothetical protein